MKLLDNAVEYTTLVKSGNELYDSYFYHSTGVYIIHCKYLSRNNHRFCSIWNTCSYIPRIARFEEEEERVILWKKNFNGNSDEFQLICSFLYGGENEQWGTWHLCEVLGFLT
jgi:hypothetical protein